MAYSAQFMKLRNQDQFWTARQSGGYFDRVIAIHPLVDLVEPNVAKPEIVKLSTRQAMVQSMAFRYRWKSRLLRPVDFLISQSGFFADLVRKLRSRDVSLILSTDALYSGLFAYLLARRLRKPLIVAVWGNWDEVYASHRGLAMPRLLPSKRLQDVLQRFVLRRADHVLVGNQNNLEYVVRHGARREVSSVISVARNLHEAHFTEPRDRRNNSAALNSLGLPPARNYLAYVGRLVEEKHPDDALKAMIKVARQEQNVVGLLVGEGNMRPQLERTIAQAGLSDRIKLLGNIDQVSLSNLLPHTIVLSPLTGMALLEAGLAGAPIVAYERDWQTEFIEDKVNGYLVHAQDWNAMADKALELIRDPATAKRFSDAIRRRAMNIADRKRILDQERSIYDRVIEAHGRRIAAA
jgi:glycosyltransferase involved in cell wall biosynthesis